MKDNYLNSINRAFSEVRAWKATTLVVSVLCAFLAWTTVQLARNQTVVLVPHNLATDTGRMAVASNGEIRGTSSEYLANTALSDLALITNFTPDNVLTTYKRFLNRLTEPLFASQEGRLLAQAAEYKSRGVSQSFFPVEVKTTPDGRQMEVTGTLVQSISGKEINRLKMTYVISYQSYKGFLHVSDVRPKESVAKK